MRVTLTPEDLIAFEEDIAAAFLRKEIRAPIHLSGGNERQLIDIFRQHVEPEDWCLCSWRSHYHCLLKGVPPAQLKAAIVEGRSISLCFPEYRILSSAIVGGIAPIAVGLAMGIKRKGERRKVVAFIGDMTFRTGIVHEASVYARNHNLPLLWIVEDNGLSVSTDTREVWGDDNEPDDMAPTLVRYEYKNRYPHVGCGKWVAF